MFQAKQWVLDRIEQSFWIFIQQPLPLIGVLALFQIVMIELIPAVWMSMILWWNFINTSSISSIIYITLSIAVIYALFYVILLIPISIGIMKWISNIILGKHIQTQDTIWYWFQRLSDSFSVYWYMFKYVYLAPAIWFIIAWCITLYWLYFNNDIISSIWGGLMIAAWIYALFQWIYRWLKSSFAITWAVYENDFSLRQFNFSVSTTKGKWWRILWNFFVVGLICSLLLWLSSWVLWSISFIWTTSSGINIESVLQANNQDMQENLESFIGDIWDFSLMNLIINSISQVLWAIVTVFVIIFSIIFYLRLKLESQESIKGENSTVNNEL